MITLIIFIITFIAGMVVEGKYSPRLTVENRREITFNWNAARGTRNRRKLFSL